MMDKTLNCIDCGKAFIFTASEQKYFADRQLTEPKRCVVCRRIRKARLSQPVIPQDNYNRRENKRWNQDRGNSRYDRGEDWR